MARTYLHNGGVRGDLRTRAVVDSASFSRWLLTGSFPNQKAFSAPLGRFFFISAGRSSCRNSVGYKPTRRDRRSPLCITNSIFKLGCCRHVGLVRDHNSWRLSSYSTSSPKNLAFSSLCPCRSDCAGQRCSLMAGTRDNGNCIKSRSLCTCNHHVCRCCV